jgi:hypothetical protein
MGCNIMKLFLASLLVFGSSISFAQGANIKVCSSQALDDGDLVYLSGEYKKPCWQKMKTNTTRGKPQEISASQLYAKGSRRFQFAYVFTDKKGAKDYKTGSFDLIFNVKIREIADYPVVKLKNIKLYRDAITTLCRIELGSVVKGKLNNKFIATYSGVKSNLYHNNPKPRDPEKILSDFHIWFRNSANKCVRTSDSQTAKAFVINNYDFADEPNLIAWLFGSKNAVADEKNKYKSIRVEIREGSFRGSFVTGNFFLSKGGEFEVVAQDISTRNPSGQLNRALNFKVV